MDVGAAPGPVPIPPFNPPAPNAVEVHMEDPVPQAAPHYGVAPAPVEEPAAQQPPANNSGVALYICLVACLRSLSRWALSVLLCSLLCLVGF